MIRKKYEKKMHSENIDTSTSVVFVNKVQANTASNHLIQRKIALNVVASVRLEFCSLTDRHTYSEREREKETQRKREIDR